MKLSIIKGLEGDQAKEVERSFNGCLTFRKQLVKVLEEKIDAERKISSSKEFFNEPNLALKMAETLAFERGMRTLIDLLSEKI